jgi:hypothetical protein
VCAVIEHFFQALIYSYRLGSASIFVARMALVKQASCAYSLAWLLLSLERYFGVVIPLKNKHRNITANYYF